MPRELNDSFLYVVRIHYVLNSKSHYPLGFVTNLESTTCKLNFCGQASNGLILVGVDIRQNSVFALKIICQQKFLFDSQEREIPQVDQ